MNSTPMSGPLWSLEVLYRRYNERNEDGSYNENFKNLRDSLIRKVLKDVPADKAPLVQEFLANEDNPLPTIYKALIL